MAFRYRKRHIDSNDVMDPRDWNLNHANYADEFNGYLDRDNVPAEIITRDMMEVDCCNAFSSDAESSDYGEPISCSSVSWQAGNPESPFSKLSLEIKSDALLVCEWSGSWKWIYFAGSGSWNNIPGSALKRDPTQAICRFRLTVDGITVSESGYSSARRKRDSCYLAGATPVSAGNHFIQVEVQLLYIEQNSTMLEDNDLMRHGTYFLGDDDFKFTMKQRELIVRARYR